MKSHTLKIISLHDAQAKCSCDKWYFARTGAATKAEIKKEFRLHVRNTR
jgi:hypothetical protein